MKKKKLLSVVLSTVMAGGCMVGCGSADSKTAATGSNGGDDDKSPITFTIFNCDLSEDYTFDDDVAKKITELTGVTLKIEHPVAGDTQAIPLMIASGDYPDFIYAKGDTGKLIDAGAVIKLDDYIEKEGDNIKALYGDKLSRLKCSNDDPSIYTVGTYGVNNPVYDPSGNMQLQHAVLKELGYPKINSLEDYEKAIKDYMAKYPEINGKKTIGMTLMASDWRWLTTCGDIASQLAGIAGDGQFKVDEDTCKATYKFQLPEVKKYFKWLNHMNAEGLLDPESFTQKEDTYRAKLSQGNVLGITDSKWDYDSATKTLISSGMTERTYSPLSVTSDPNVKDQSLRDYGFSGGWGVAISETCADKDRAFKFLNWLASDEAQVLLNWGIEGKHYEVKDGKRQLLPEIQKQKNTDKDFAKKTGVGKYNYPFPERGDGAKDSTGNTYTPNTVETYAANYTDAEKETLAGYGCKTYLDMFPSADELGESKHGQVWQYNIPSDSDVAIIQKKADDYIQKAATQAVLGSPDEFEANWDKIQQELKDMDIQKVDDGISKLVEEKMKLWND